MLVQRQICGQCLHVAVLFPQLPQFLQLGQTETSKAPLPAVERLWRNSSFAANITHFLVALRFPQSTHNLLVRMRFSWHLSSFSFLSRGSHPDARLNLRVVSFLGLGS